jgi:hypothetical protein
MMNWKTRFGAGLLTPPLFSCGLLTAAFLFLEEETFGRETGGVRRPAPNKAWNDSYFIIQNS